MAATKQTSLVLRQKRSQTQLASSSPNRDCADCKDCRMTEVSFGNLWKVVQEGASPMRSPKLLPASNGHNTYPEIALDGC